MAPKAASPEMLKEEAIELLIALNSTLAQHKISPQLSSVLGAERTALRDPIDSIKSKINKTHSLTRDTIPE